MTARAFVTITKQITVEVDVDELVERFGPKARTQKFLKDWAVGNYDGNRPGNIISTTFQRQTT